MKKPSPVSLLPIFLMLSLGGCSLESRWTPPAGIVQSGGVVVLGIDGLDRVLLESLVRQGQLPAFARVMQQGVVADMAVGQPILSPRIWTTVASGYGPETHGILDWVRPDGRPFRAGDVAVRRVWDAAGDAGKTVLVSGWLMTTPVSEVNGVMLGDEVVLRGSLDMDPNLEPMRDPAVVDGWLAWPKSTLDQVEGWMPGARWQSEHDLAYQLASYGALLHPLRRDETHVRSFEALQPDLQPDLSMIYLSGADQLSHQYWPFSDAGGVRAMQADPGLRMRSAQQLSAMHRGKRSLPLSDRPTDAAALAEGGRWIPDYYRYLDSVLARFMSRMEGSSGTLIICSDHGFRVGDRPVPLFADHRDPAVLMAWGGRVKPGGSRQARVSMLDVAPTIDALLGIPSAVDMPGRVLTELFDVRALPRQGTRVETVPGAQPGAPSDHPRRQQLEALGYIEGNGRPIPQPR